VLLARPFVRSSIQSFINFGPEFTAKFEGRRPRAHDSNCKHKPNVQLCLTSHSRTSPGPHYSSARLEKTQPAPKIRFISVVSKIQVDGQNMLSFIHSILCSSFTVC
jgi:hypothetical protein